jgi:hypothetical protein
MQRDVEEFWTWLQITTEKKCVIRMRMRYSSEHTDQGFRNKYLGSDIYLIYKSRQDQYMYMLIVGTQAMYSTPPLPKPTVSQLTLENLSNLTQQWLHTRQDEWLDQEQAVATSVVPFSHTTISTKGHLFREELAYASGYLTECLYTNPNAPAIPDASRVMHQLDGFRRDLRREADVRLKGMKEYLTTVSDLLE